MFCGVYTEKLFPYAPFVHEILPVLSILRGGGAHTEKLFPHAPFVHEIPLVLSILRGGGAYTKKLFPCALLIVKKGIWQDIFFVYAPLKEKINIFWGLGDLCGALGKIFFIYAPTQSNYHIFFIWERVWVCVKKYFAVVTWGRAGQEGSFTGDLFLQARRQAVTLAQIFGECRKGYIPALLAV